MKKILFMSIIVWCTAAQGQEFIKSGAIEFEVRVRIDTPKEREYFQHGGILHYVLRQLAASSKAA